MIGIEAVKIKCERRFPKLESLLYCCRQNDQGAKRKEGSLVTPSQFYFSLQMENKNGKMKSSGSCSSYFSSESKRLEI